MAELDRVQQRLLDIEGKLRKLEEAVGLLRVATLGPVQLLQVGEAVGRVDLILRRVAQIEARLEEMDGSLNRERPNQG